MVIEDNRREKERCQTAPGKNMTIAEVNEFLDTYSRSYKHLDVSRMRNFMALLGDPQKKMHYVHVAGTNGKGSCSCMTASILQQAGYKVGLFTSPHIMKFNERIMVNGVQITDDELAELMTEVKAVNDTLEYDQQVNWFEFVTAMGFVWFAKQKCDIVALEVGVGGEFDGTNVIDVPDCAVLMNIGLDHTHQLGDTVEKIARTKSGIIKAGGDAVIYRTTPSVEAVIEQRCNEVGATLHKADFDSIRSISESLDGQVFDACGYEALRIPLAGEHQQKNTAVVLGVVEVLRSKGWKITDEDVREGLAKTSWPVRFEIMSHDPTFILDGGHNPQCIETVKDSLERLVEPGKHIVFLTGILKDKDTFNMTRILSTVSREFVVVTPDSHRAMPADQLAELFVNEGCEPVICDSIVEGIETAIAKAGPDGVVCCVGSMYLAGDVRKYFVEKE